VKSHLGNRCDEWTPAQVKAFRLLVNRSATWADWNDELLAVELADLQAMDFDLALTGFDPTEIDDLLFRPEADDSQAGSRTGQTGTGRECARGSMDLRGSPVLPDQQVFHHFDPCSG